MIETVLDLVSGRVILGNAGEGTYRAENLVCVNSDGSLRWRAGLPANSGQDYFVGVALDGDRVRANTWSGWVMWLDCATGTAIKTAFAK
jgi:hypothetical protein